jgi:hypothetical protein
MYPLIQCKTTILPLLIAGVLACFGLLPKAEAVVPAPDGGYSGFNTAEGQNALFGRTTGVANTAVGWYSLFSNTDGSYNTGVGAGTLLFNVGNQSTGDGIGNTALGAEALLFNTTGFYNTATGMRALASNTTGHANTATGASALSSNTGAFNTANGFSALFRNTNGVDNTATGASALCFNTTGSSNTAVGDGAGLNATTGSHNVYIGAGMQGIAGESNTCYIASIFGQTSASGAGVYVNSNNKLGTLTSSCRFKDDIKPMERLSEALFALKPVTFHYKREIDPAGTSQLGLVAEDVEKVNPDLVVRDKHGKAYSVRYDQVNAMLLNEFLKEHRKVEKQQTTVAELKSILAQQQKDFELTAIQQQKEIQALTASLKEQGSQIQKVSAQLKVSRLTPRVAVSKGEIQR